MREPSDPVDEPTSPDRRHALRILGTAAGGIAIGAGASLAGCGMRRDPDLVTRVPLAEVPIGSRVRVLHGNDPVELLRHSGGVRARLLVCTHEYCTVFWLQREGVYHCPCHAGRWDANADPVAGPVDAPLETLDAAIDGDDVTLRYRPGAAS